MGDLKIKSSLSKKNIFIIAMCALFLFSVAIYFYNAGEPEIDDKGFLENEGMVAEGKDDVLVSVNGEEIMKSEVLMVKSFVENNPEMQGQMISEEQILDEMIKEELLLQEAEKKGYFPTFEQAEEEIETMISHQGMTIKDFKEMIEAEGILYEEEIYNYKRSIAVQDYIENYFSDKSLEVTEEEVEKLYEEYKLFSPEEMPPLEEIEEYLVFEIEQNKYLQELETLTESLKEKAEIVYF